jgi:hypothetical protein
MLRLAKIGLAIVIVVSVTAVLITPDLSDDVDGALQRNHLTKVTAVPISVSQFQFLFLVIGTFRPAASQRQLLSKLLDLTCVRLC